MSTKPEYPLSHKRVGRPGKTLSLEKGEWYLCVKSVSKAFTEDKVYLCVNMGHGQLAIVDDVFACVLQNCLASEFRKI